MFSRLSCSRVNDATSFDDVADDVLVAAELVNEMLPAAHITTYITSLNAAKITCI